MKVITDIFRYNCIYMYVYICAIIYDICRYFMIYIYIQRDDH